MKKKIPIGLSNFKEIIEENFYYVDKSLFIKEIIDSGTKSTLIPRPRRFGKTLNLSMLRYFFEKCDEDRTHLFENLEIFNLKDQSYKKHLGRYPTLYLSLKDCKYNNWKDCILTLRSLIASIFANHEYLVDSGLLKRIERNEFNQILNGEGEDAIYSSGLGKLVEYLYRYHKEKVVVLIDEYDVPIQSGYFGNFYDDVINFMRPFLSKLMKDNDFLYKGVLTGILRVAKESIFSGLNNFEVCSLLSNDNYSDKFGLLEGEVKELLEYYDISSKMAEVKDWYDGYVFGGESIYNPWSIICYAKNWKDGFKPHWVNTSGNDLVKDIISRSDNNVKSELEELLKGNSIEKVIDDNIVFRNVEKSSNTIWSFLLMTGYLKIVDKKRVARDLVCNLKIPNEEVIYCYENMILSWFDESISDNSFYFMLKCLITGDIENFTGYFEDFVIKSFSFFDTSGKNPEKVYHAFVLGLLLGLNKTHELKSNRESGYGRYDIMLIPRDAKHKGAIIEFKTVNKSRNETLQSAAQKALQQIEDKKYETELQSRNITDIIKLGIAFEGKKVLVQQKHICSS